MRDKLREVRFTPYRKGCGPRFRLVTYDTGRTDSMGKSVLAYEFYEGRTLIFKGEDFHCSPCHAIDSDEACGALMTFLTLRPGDTDAEYFTDYTAAQLAFANSSAAQLLAFAYSDDPSIAGSDDAGTFADLDGADDAEGDR